MNLIKNFCDYVAPILATGALSKIGENGIDWGLDKVNKLRIHYLKSSKSLDSSSSFPIEINNSLISEQGIDYSELKKLLENASSSDDENYNF